MQSVIGRLDDSVMRMIEDSVDESSKSHLIEGAEVNGANSVDEWSKSHLSASGERKEAVKMMPENASENEDEK